MNFLFKLFCVFLFSALLGKGSNDTLKNEMKFSINASFILNRTFSHFNYISKPQLAEGTSVFRAQGKRKVSPGFSIGAELSSYVSKNWIVFGGLSYSHTNSNYQLDSSTLITKTSYIKNTNTSFDINATYHFFNVNAGAQNKLYKNLYLRELFSISTNVLSVENKIGGTYVHEKIYTTTGGKNWYFQDKNSYIGQSGKYSSTKFECSFSYQLGLNYFFKLKQHDYSVFCYRNFSYPISLPWWGIGASIYFDY